MKESTEKLNQLPEEKKILLEKMLREKRLKQAQQITSEIKPIQREDNRYPLSYAQEKIWIANAINSNTVLYNMVGVTRVRGVAQMPLFVEGLKATFAKHEILRMNFRQEGGSAYARINEAALFEPSIHDYSQNPHDSKAVINEVIDQIARKPFDLEDEILIRVAIICHSHDDWTIVLVMHHLVGDGISINIILGEALEYANKKSQNLEITTKNLPIQFKDYAWWERNKERDEQEEKAAEDYWQTHLERANFSLEMLQVKQNAPALNKKSHRCDFNLEPEMVKQIQIIAQKEKITAFSIYLSALKLLIYKYSMQEDQVLGVVTFGRDLAEVSHLIGCFVDVLPIRSVIEPQTTFIDYMRQVYQNFLGNYAKKDAYFKQEQQYTPQLLFNYKESSEVRTQMEGLEFNSQEVNSGYSKAPMEFDLIMSGDQIIGGINYQDGIFDEVFAQDFTRRYLLILNAIISDPAAFLNQRISEIGVITANEQEQLLKLASSVIADYPKDKTVVELFEEQVEKMPDHVAIVYEDEQLTYRELNEKANQLAHVLRSKGVGRESLVGVFSERSIAMIVGIFGIIKAGGVYVPLDPTYPTERIAYIVEDCDLKVILTYQTEMATERELIDLGKWELFENTPKENLSTVNQPNDLLYLLFTSGTTGKPKGVMIEHKNVVNFVKQPNYVNLDEKTIMLQTGSMSFDASTFELWGTFLNGGKMVLLPQDILLNATLLKEKVIYNNINTMFVTTSLFNQLVDLDVSIFEPLKQLLVGGEAISEAHAEKLVNRNQDLLFLNIYGPTENTSFSLCYSITPETLKEKLPVGRPIPNTQVYIRNGSTLCGIGMAGELCVAGDGVARGYLNQPELTATKFIDNPYGEGKLYMTGDLAKWLPDGNIEYLGRLDDQVKIRGFRIELREIESVLRKQAGVTNCAVVVRVDAAGDKALASYIVSDVELDMDTLKAGLAKELPNYMIPNYMMQIKKLPLTPTGKLDRRALPQIAAVSATEYVAPTNEMEKIICAAFAEVLEVERVGIHDEFFQMGGHSLRALKLVNLLEERTGKGIRVKHVFEASNVRQLAVVLENLDKVKYERIPEANQQETYEMSRAQKRMYLLWQLSPTEVVYNIPVILKLRNAINEDNIQTALEKLIARHEILRTTFHEKDERLFQVISDVAPNSVSIQHLEEAELHNWYEKSITPFDLEKGPLYQIKIARTKQSDYLFVDMHHIVSDEVSIVLFIKEFSRLLEGEELPHLDRQYKDYSEWVKQQDFSGSQQYWTESLQNYPVLELPTDYTRPNEQQFSGATEKIMLDEETTDKIKKLVQKYNVTEYMFFLGLISILLGKLSNKEELVIGTPASLRIHKDTEQMLGMFVNTLALKLTPSGDKSLKTYLTQIKEQVLMAQENQAYPFEDLVSQVVKKRDLSRHPIFDVMVAYQNSEIFLSLLEIGERQRFEEANADVAKFDLNFAVLDYGNQIAIELNYATSLFKKETIRIYLERLLRLLNHMLKQDHTE